MLFICKSIRADIAQQEHQEIDRAVQLDLPIIVGQPVPILYVQMDGNGVPVVTQETLGRKGKLDGLPAHIREAKPRSIGSMKRALHLSGHSYRLSSARSKPQPRSAPL